MSAFPVRQFDSRRYRRLCAIATALLFAICVLVASAPHDHEGAAVGSSASAIAGLSGRGASHDLIQSAASCPLCDWLYAPNLPAQPPALLEFLVPAPRLVSTPPLADRVSPDFRLSYISSRGPPPSIRSVRS